MSYLIILVIIFGCVILAVLVVVPLFRFSQMQSADMHLLTEFREMAHENRRAIKDLERRLDLMGAPPVRKDGPS